MSKIYKINHVVNNNIIKTYVFIGDNNVDTDEVKDVLKDINTPYQIIHKFIYNDDSIIRIKEKIMKYTDINISTYEMYLFNLQKKKVKLNEIFNIITYYKKYELSDDLLNIFLSNLSSKPNIISDFDKNYEKKDTYDYNDFLNLNLNSLKEYYYANMIGQKIIYKNNIYTVNPYNIEKFDDVIYNFTGNMISTQNKYLLFEYNDIENNNIYLCDAENVINYSKNIFNKEDYLIKLFFPVLYNSEKIKTIDSLLKKKQKLLDKDSKRIDKTFEQYNSNIDYFYKLHKKFSDKINYINHGIKNIYFTFYQTNNIKLPLESIFKLIKSNSNVELIKYNPGVRKENIYRLYTNGHFSKNGAKIPNLFVSNRNKKSKIIKLSKELAKRKKVSYYVNYNNQEIYYEFLENGSIDVKISFKEPKSIKFIDELVSNSLNKFLLDNIKQYLIQSGYSYDYFISLNQNNVKINSIDLIMNIDETKKVNLNKYIKCLSSIFNINNGVMTKNKDEINLTFKRVSSFHKMNSIMTFITLSRKKMIRLDEIIEKLKENFNLSEDEAKLHIIQWQQEVNVKLDNNENAKIDIESNPGFEVTINANVLDKTVEYSHGTLITVNNITNINYINFFNVYLNALIIMVYKNDLLDQDTFQLKCLGKTKTKDIKELDEVKALKEDDPLGIKNDGKITFENNDDSDDDALDAFFAIQEDDEENEEDDDEAKFDDIKTVNVDELGDSEITFGEEVDMEDDIQETDKDFEKIEFDTDDAVFGDIDTTDENQDVNKTVDFGEDFDDDGNISGMEDGWDDELSSDIEGGNKDEIDIDLTNLKLSGAKSIFINRLRDREPEIFPKKLGDGYQSYAKACPVQFKKQPIILTDEEKKYIDEKDSEYNSKSYDEHITYGSTEKKYHYICPRFWCIRDDNGKGRSLTMEQINKGECGGWNAIIPEGAKKITKGKRIYQFTDKRFHKEGVDTDNPLVYKPMYPGFQSPDKHPKGLCVPCCFTSPTSYDKNGNWQKIKDGKKEIFINKQTGEKRDTPPTIELDSYKPNPEPTFDKDEDGNIIMDSIKGVKQIRSSPAPDRMTLYNNCNQSSNEREDRSDEKKIVEKKIKLDDAPLIEAFPLKSGQIGYLPIPLQKFLNYKSFDICKDNNKLKNNVNCLMRKGVEFSNNQSFLSAIAYVFYSIITREEDKQKRITKNINASIEKLKEVILNNLTVDKFVSLHNGNLVSIFHKNITKVDLDKYSSSKLYKNSIQNVKYMEKVVSSYENYINFIKDQDIFINYQYLWDIICEPISENGVLFENGINMIILSSPSDDITGKIEIICPTNSNNIFDISKPTIMLYNRNNFFEPLCQIKKIQKKYKIKCYFEFDNIHRNIPEIYKVMFKIKQSLLSGCKNKKSMPRKYNKEYGFDYNITLKQLLKELDKLNYKTYTQILNYDSQVIAVIAEDDNNKIYIPCLPSGILNDLNSIFISSDVYTNNYSDTVSILEKLWNDSNNNIKSKPVKKVISDEMIVGVITITNQFVPIVPEVDNNEDDLIPIKNTQYLKNDNDFLLNDDIDKERILIVKKIKLETNFYNMFRNTFKIIINENDKKEFKRELIEILKNSVVDYIEKLNKIVAIVKNILQDSIEFINYNLNDLSSLDDLILCFGLSEEQCSKTINCGSFLKNNNMCKLLIPKINLLNKKISNEKIYFEKLADELIRFNKIRDYIFKPKQFLSFERMEYNLTDEEIILLEDTLLNNYLENVTIDNNNKYVNSNHTYETVNPFSHVPYQEIFNLNDIKIKNDENLKVPKIVNKEVELSTNCDAEKPTLKFTGWIDYGLNNEYFNIKEYKQSPFCSFILMKDIISNHLKRTVDVYEIKKKLIEIIKSEYNKGWETKEILSNLYKHIGKTHLYKDMLIANWDNWIMNEDYYISEYEFYLLCKEYKINAILLTNKGNNYILKSTNTSFLSTVINNDNLYIVLIKGSGLTKKSPKYGLVQTGKNISLMSYQFKNLLSYVGNLKSIDEYYDNFKIIYDKFIAKRRERKKASSVKFRLKKLKKVKLNIPE